MRTILVVSRHLAAMEFVKDFFPCGSDDTFRQISHILPSTLNDLDKNTCVIGNVPLHLASEICKRCGLFYGLSMNVPESHRGKELSLEDMEAFGADIIPYTVTAGKSFGQHYEDGTLLRLRGCS